MWISEWSYSTIHMKGLAVRKRFSGFCGFKGGGAAHKNIEAPRSINLAMPKSCIQVTSP